MSGNSRLTCECPRRAHEQRCRCRGCGRWLALTGAQEADLLVALTHFFSDEGGGEGRRRQRLRRRRGRLSPWTLHG